ncbi:MAG: hypothetical protein DRI33_04205 [Caldiserica bacterium]|nr:MAG: hypothetical protein DRI33_04205 [Caldisericota bacterium]
MFVVRAEIAAHFFEMLAKTKEKTKAKEKSKTRFRTKPGVVYTMTGRGKKTQRPVQRGIAST